MFDLQHYLANNISLINAALDRKLPAETERPAALHKAMRYSVFAGDGRSAGNGRSDGGGVAAVGGADLVGPNRKTGIGSLGNKVV